MQVDVRADLAHADFIQGLTATTMPMWPVSETEAYHEFNRLFEGRQHWAFINADLLLTPGMSPLLPKCHESVSLEIQGITLNAVRVLILWIPKQMLSAKRLIRWTRRNAIKAPPLRVRPNQDVIVLTKEGEDDATMLSLTRRLQLWLCLGPRRCQG